MARERLIREHLTLKGADLFLRLPSGEMIAADASEANVVLERPDLSRPSHAPDWSSVRWNSARYNLTPKQRLVVCLLWRAWEDGTTDRQRAPTCWSGRSPSSRSSGTCSASSDAWGSLIVSSEPHGGPSDSYPPGPARRIVLRTDSPKPRRGGVFSFLPQRHPERAGAPPSAQGRLV
jgi:hypothetical protein